MSCPDLKAVALGEASPAERATAEQHRQECPSCVEEWDRLHLTMTALRSIPDEEVPQRIAFISDKVFEPRWYQRLWRSVPVMGFASAALLSAAIVTHAVYPRDAAAPVAVLTPAPPPINVEAIVSKAVADAEARQVRRTAEIVAAAELRLDQREREIMASVASNFEVLTKKVNYLRRELALANTGDGQ